MRKQVTIFCILSILSICLSWGQNNIVVTPAGEMDRAVSGHFAGIVDGKLQTWGGCNFPNVPCADGGQKVFYPKAYGASVTVPGETVYLGGMNENGSDDTVSPTNLPKLPKPLDNFAACYGVDRIFVAGGQSNGVPNKDVYALDWPNGKEWVKLCELPEEGRLQPCMAVQNAPEGKALFIFGGYTDPQASSQTPSNSPFKGEKKDASVYLKGLKLNLKTLEWKGTTPTTIFSSPL